MRTSRARRRLQQGRGREALAYLEARSVARDPRCGRRRPGPHARPSGASTANVLVLDRPTSERQVAALDLVPPQHRRERLVRLVGLGDHHQAARPRVETVDDARAKRAAERWTAASPIPSEPVHEGAAPPALRRMGERARPASRSRAGACPRYRTGTGGPSGASGIRGARSDLDALAAREAERLGPRRHRRPARGRRRSPAGRRRAAGRCKPASTTSRRPGLAVERLSAIVAESSRSAPDGRPRSAAHARRRAPTTIGAVGEVEDRPDVQVDEVDDPPAQPGSRAGCGR